MVDCYPKKLAHETLDNSVKGLAEEVDGLEGSWDSKSVLQSSIHLFYYHFYIIVSFREIMAGKRSRYPKKKGTKKQKINGTNRLSLSTFALALHLIAKFIDECRKIVNLSDVLKF